MVGLFWALLLAFLCRTVSREAMNSGKRGIVIPMGAQRLMFAGAYATIMGLRQRHGCDLPVQLWAYRSEIERMPPSMKKFVDEDPLVELKTFPVDLDVNQKVPAWDIEGEWYLDYYRFASMPLAIIHTDFEEVIAVDADSVVVADPRKLFDTTQYTTTGTFFLWDKLIDYWPAWYPPYVKTWLFHFLKDFDATAFSHVGVGVGDIEWALSERRQEMLNERAYTQHTMESSLVVMDKRRQRRTVAILKELVLRRGEEVFSHIYGDKETYWMAATLAGQAFAFNDWAAGHWSDPSNINGTRVCAGNRFMEPGTMHYMPGPAKEVLSVNECKGVGCVQFGARRLQVSPRMTREEHKQRYFAQAGRIRLPMANSTLPRGTKG